MIHKISLKNIIKSLPVFNQYFLIRTGYLYDTFKLKFNTAFCCTTNSIYFAHYLSSTNL